MAAAAREFINVSCMSGWAEPSSVLRLPRSRQQSPTSPSVRSSSASSSSSRLLDPGPSDDELDGAGGRRRAADVGDLGVELGTGAVVHGDHGVPAASTGLPAICGEAPPGGSSRATP